MHCRTMRLAVTESQSVPFPVGFGICLKRSGKLAVLDLSRKWTERLFQ